MPVVERRRVSGSDAGSLQVATVSHYWDQTGR